MPNWARTRSSWLKQLDGEIAGQAERVETGTEQRLVDVVVLANFVTGTADTVRTDTSEIVSARPLTEQERQQAFHFRDPASEPDTGAPA